MHRHANRRTVRWVVAPGVLAALLLAACDPGAVAPASYGGGAGGATATGARIEVPERIKDFGEVVSGTLLEHDFVIRNSGTETLEILKLRPSCGCTAAVLGDGNKRIPPGGSTTVRVSYTAKGAVEFENIVTVMHNGSGEAPELRIIGKSRYALTVPKRINLGQLVAGKASTIERTLDIADSVNLKIKAVGSSLPYIKVETRPAGHNATLVLTLAGRPPPQTIKGWVWIDTDHEVEGRAVIQLDGTISGPLEADPPRLHLGTIRAGTPASKSVRIRAGSGRVGTIAVEVAGPPWVTAEVTPVGDEAEVVVSLAADAKPGHSVGYVRVRRGKTHWIEIPFHGYVISTAHQAKP